MKQISRKAALFLLTLALALGLLAGLAIPASADEYESVAGIKIIRNEECVNPEEYICREWDTDPVLWAGDELQVWVYNSNYQIVTPEACGLTVKWTDSGLNQLGTGSTYTVKAEDKNYIQVWIYDGDVAVSEAEVQYTGNEIVVPVIPIHSIELYVDNVPYDRLYLEKREGDEYETMHSNYECFSECQLHNFVPEPGMTLSVKLFDAKGNEITSPVNASNMYWGRAYSGYRYMDGAPAGDLEPIPSATGLSYTISADDTDKIIAFKVTQTVPEEQDGEVNDVPHTHTAWVRRKALAHHEEGTAVCTLTTSDRKYTDQGFDTIDCALRAAAFANGTKTIKMVANTTETVELFDQITFDLNGHTLTAANDPELQNTAFVLRGGSSLTLNDAPSGTGKIVGGTGSYALNWYYKDQTQGCTGGCVNVDDNATFVMNGGTLTGGNTQFGGAVMVLGRCARFIMYGGALSGNTAKYGGGAYLQIGIASNDEEATGEFTMNGGEISNNTADGSASEDGTMYDILGDKNGNLTGGNGGGIYIGEGAKDMAWMNGGVIKGNRAVNGGGVYNYELYTGIGHPPLIMSGGSIEGNEADNNGGGVCGSVLGSAAVIKDNTAGNRGGGVYGSAGSADGNLTLTGNTAKIGGGGSGFLNGAVNITGNSARLGGGWYGGRVALSGVCTIDNNSFISAPGAYGENLVIVKTEESEKNFVGFETPNNIAEGSKVCFVKYDEYKGEPAYGFISDGPVQDVDKLKTLLIHEEGAEINSKFREDIKFQALYLEPSNRKGVCDIKNSVSYGYTTISDGLKALTVDTSKEGLYAFPEGMPSLPHPQNALVLLPEKIIGDDWSNDPEIIYQTVEQNMDLSDLPNDVESIIFDLEGNTLEGNITVPAGKTLYLYPTMNTWAWRQDQSKVKSEIIGNITVKGNLCIFGGMYSGNITTEGDGHVYVSADVSFLSLGTMFDREPNNISVFKVPHNTDEYAVLHKVYQDERCVPYNIVPRRYNAEMYAKEYRYFISEKLPAKLETEPAAVENISCDGQEHALVTAGVEIKKTVKDACDEDVYIDMGTVYYRFKKAADPDESYSEWSTVIPTAKDAGTYTVQYYVQGNDVCYDSEIKALEVLIRNDPELDATTLQDQASIYNGNPQALVNPAKVSEAAAADGVKIKYSLDLNGENWSEEIPTAVNAGTYNVYYMVEGSANYSGVNPSETLFVEATIQPRPVTITAADQTVQLGGAIATTVDQATLSGAVGGHVLSAATFTVTGVETETNEGVITVKAATNSGVITLSDAKIIDSSAAEPDNDVTANYVFTYPAGRLIVQGKVYYIMQNANGSWPESPEGADNEARPGDGTTFTFDKTYEHYTVSVWSTEYKPAEDGRTATYPGAVVNLGGNPNALYVYYSREIHDLKFYDYNGQVWRTEKIRYGDALTSYAGFTPPAREGYTFAAWSTDPNQTAYADKEGNVTATNVVDFSNSALTMTEAGLTVYPIWVRDRLAITLVPGGDEATPVTMGIGSDGKEQSTSFNVEIGEEIGMTGLNSTTRVAYTLEGWYTKGGVKWEPNKAMQPEYCDKNSNGTPIYEYNATRRYYYYEVTMTANWTPISVTVNYNAGNDGTCGTSSVTTTFNSTITLPNVTPNNESKTFTGWLDKNGKLHSAGEQFLFNDWTLTAGDPDVTLAFTAQYIDTPTYAITFDTDGGTAIEPIQNYVNKPINAPAAPTKTGYTFEGWTLATDGSNFIFPHTSTTDESIALKAKWKVNQYTITFDGNGGTTPDSITQDFGTTISVTDPTRTGYQFTGWRPALPTTMPAEDLSLSASWSIKSFKITFITGDGGSVVAPITQEFGSAITPPDDPTKDGFTFVGWDPEIPNYMPAEDITINARWKENQTAPDAPAATPTDTGKTIKLNEPQTNEEYILVPKGQTPTDDDWKDAKKLGDGVTEIVFSGLTPNTPYDIYARKYETDTLMPSPASEKNEVTTLKEKQTAPAAPSAKATSPTSVEVDPTVSGAEYIIVKKGAGVDAITAWTSPSPVNGKVVFEGCEANTEYDVYARMKETNRQYASLPSDPTPVKTPKRKPAVTAPTPVTTAVYDGSNISLLDDLNSGSTTGGTLQYSLDGTTNWGTDVPTGKNAGTYNVWYRVVGDDEYEDVEATSVKATIVPRTAELNWTNTALTYNGKAQAPTATLSNLCAGDACEVTVDGAKTDAGEGYTATATALSNKNYKLPESGTTTTFNIAPKTVGLEWSTTPLAYNGSAQAPTATATGLCEGDAIEVTVTGAQTAPGENYTATAAELTGEKAGNYILPDVKTKSFTIAKAAGQVIPDVEIKQAYAVPSVAQSVAGKMPKDAGNLTYKPGTPVLTTGSVEVSDFSVDVYGNVTATLSGGATGNTVKLPVIISSDNYANSTVNVVVELMPKEPQTISAGEVTATYGDTDKRVSASVTVPAAGGGAISYAVKAGSEDYIAVDSSTGALTVKKVPADGKAWVTVTAAETLTHLQATLDVLVTLSKANPVATAPVATATYGQTLKDVALTNPDGNTPGTWTWEPDTATNVGEVGEHTFKAKFTPNDTVNYNIVEHVDVKVTVGQANPIATAPAGTATYGQTLADVALTNPEGNTPGTWTWEPDGTTSVGNAGTQTFKAKFTPEDAKNYKTIENVDVTVTVGQADPVATAPAATATYGQTLKDVALTNPEGNTPGTWTWETDTATNVGEVGEYTFKAKFTPDDTVNYKIVEHVDVKVTVGQANPIATAPAGTATYGQTLGDVALANPEGNTPGTWTWEPDGTTSVGNAGTQTFKAKFTPEDTKNYKTIENVDVTITVDRAANPAIVAPTAAVMKGGNTIDLAGNVTLNGATGAISFEIVGDAKGCALNGSVLTTGPDTCVITVNVTVAQDANHYALAATPITVTISDKNAQTISVSDVTATYGDTDKRVSATVTAPETGGGAISYAVKAGSEDYIEVDPATGALTIKKVPADGKAFVTVTAAETQTLLPQTLDVAVTIGKASGTAAAVTGNNLTYNGTAQPLVTVTGEASGGGMQYAIGTETGATGAYSTAIPEGAEPGTYYIWCKLVGDGNHPDTEPIMVRAEISKANANMTAPTAASGLTYTGEPQALVTAGSGEGGTIKYAVTSDETEPADADYTFDNDSLPTGTEARTYHVWYKVFGDANHSDTAAAHIAVSIKSADTGNTAPASDKQLVYTGEAQALVNAGSVSGGTLEYALGADDATAPADGWSQSVPAGIDAGVYHVWYRVKGDANHNDVPPACVNVQIAKAAIAPTVSITGWSYGQSANAPVVSGNVGNGAVTYAYSDRADGTFVEGLPGKAGTWFVRATVAETANHQGATTEAISIAIARATATVTANSASKIVGDEDPALTATLTGLVNGDAQGVIAYTVERASGEKIGAYDITPKGEATQGNYDVNYVSGVLTIEPDPNDGDYRFTAKEEEGAPKTEVEPFSEEDMGKLLTEEEKKVYSDGVSVRVNVVTTLLDEKTVPEGDKNLIAIKMKNMGGDFVLAGYIDISMFLKVGKAAPRQVTDLNGATLKALVSIPEELLKGPYTDFMFVQTHEDGTTKVHSKRVGDAIEMDLTELCTFALVYKEAKPDTKDDLSGFLLAKLTSTGKNSLKLTWMNLPDADGYDVFISLCNSGSTVRVPKYEGTVKAGKALKYEFKGLKKGRFYKAYVKAWVMRNGKKVYLAQSPLVHCVTGNQSTGITNAKSVKLNKNKLTLTAGGKAKLKMTVKAIVKGKSLLDHGDKYRFVSSDKTVATVKDDGTVKAVGAGTCDIYALAANGERDKCTVTVYPVPKGVSFKNEAYEVKKGKTLNLAKQIKLNPKNAQTTYAWTSSDKRIAKVNSKGEVKALKKGTVTITVKTANGKKAKVKVTVK